MEYKIRVFSIWEFGQRKDSDGNPHQEDCTYPLPNDLKDSDRTFILCDGMGGHDAGEVASATVCQAMGDYILNDGHDAEGIFTDDDLLGAINAAFAALDTKDNGAEKKMGTTMTFLKLHNEGATVAHMGDSRVYHIRPGKDGASTQILFVSEDHSLVNDLVKIGELTREEARMSKQRNVITRAMQPMMDRKPKADIKHIRDIRAGDFFYMCSDGMLEQEEMENGESIRNIFSNAIATAEEKVKILTEVTQNNKDNHTALIIQILEVEGGLTEEADSTAVPSIGVGVIEDDDQTGSDSSGNESTEGNSPAASGEAPAAEAKPQSKAAAKKHLRKPGLPRLVMRCLYVVVVVVAVILCVNFLKTCSKKPEEQKVEQQDSNGKKKQKKDEGKRRENNQSSQTSASQGNGQSAENAAGIVNQVLEEQNGGGENNETGSTPENGTSVSILGNSSGEVINSDQTNLNNVVNHHGK
ncbi:MAG: protein phosphatase 2C domain-containing protein [Clostridium sp.]|nr:protein phosphatase 2C domain-containing protein [Clostridium sp.]